ncbi:MAG: hypothetical protein EOP07_07410 [Proteobacteria bacterium]|nr:MAG: hypothetical protein EOP07_07410 [Pseudomonadota bacterium]
MPGKKTEQFEKEIGIELVKVELWLATARKQYEDYKDPADRVSGEFVRYDYYLQASAREASFALEHLLRAVHFIYRKHPEPSFQMTEELLLNANRYLEKANRPHLKIEAIAVLRAAVANDEDLNADVKVNKDELGAFINSVDLAFQTVKQIVHDHHSS